MEAVVHASGMLPLIRSVSCRTPQDDDGVQEVFQTAGGILSKPGDLDAFSDLRTSCSLLGLKKLQLIGRISETRSLKKERDRSGVGGSEPRRVLKCSCQTLSRSSLVVPGIFGKRDSVGDCQFPLMMCQELR